MLFLGGLTLISLYLRTRALGASLWMDEGLSIGIASQPFFDIPGVLRQDGSPPLYYLVLHLWMEVFGTGPADTQGLSVAISLLAVPGGLWAGWTLFGKRAGLICAALGAFNPFLTVYAQETRMYSLMVVLSLLLSATFLHVFVFRRRKYLPLFVGLLAAILYTHSWGIFVTAGTLVALVPLLLATDDRRGLLPRRGDRLRRGLRALRAVAADAALPDGPHRSAMAQLAAARRPGADRQGAARRRHGHRRAGARRGLGPRRGAHAGRSPTTRSARRCSRRSRSASPRSRSRGCSRRSRRRGPPATSAWRWARSSCWPPSGLARAGNLGLVALVIVLGIWAIPKTGQPREQVQRRRPRRRGVRGRCGPGDLVVTLQPEQHPLIHYHLRNDMIEATQLGEVQRKGVMDWRDVQDKLEDATPAKNLKPLLDRLPRSRRVLLVHPVTSSIDDWDAPWTQLVRRRSAQWGQALEADPRFTRDKAVPAFYRRAQADRGARRALHKDPRLEEEMSDNEPHSHRSRARHPGPARTRPR